MAWTLPRTWVTGEIVTASLMNTHVRDNLRYSKGLDGVPTIESGLVIDNTDGDEYLKLPLLSTAESSTVLATEGKVAFDEQTHTPKYYNGSAVKDIGDHGSLGGLTDDDHTQYQKESLLTTAGDVPYATGNATWARLGIGTSLQWLRTNAGATAPEWVSGAVVSKIKAETRDMTAATGDVAYTGYGFSPKGLIIYCNYTDGLTKTSIGFGDGSLAERCFWTANAGAPILSTTAIIYMYEGAGLTQTAVLKTLDADGFTLTWTRTGATGATTANFLVFAIG